MSEINHEIKIQSSMDKTFKALMDLSDLKAWHTKHIEETTNGEFNFDATGKPSFTWKIVPHKTDQTVSWECLKGPGDSVGTKVIYALSKTDDDRLLVELRHTSWPNQNGNFRKCNTLWGILLHHLKEYLETGKSDPAIT